MSAPYPWLREGPGLLALGYCPLCAGQSTVFPFAPQFKELGQVDILWVA